MITLNRMEPGPQLRTLGFEMTIRTETQNRTFDAGTDFAGGNARSTLQASDPFLDAIAFSKGRFAVEVPGAPTLYIPSYPEITRVIEDCR
jgi:hypothetical protein